MYPRRGVFVAPVALVNIALPLFLQALPCGAPTRSTCLLLTRLLNDALHREVCHNLSHGNVDASGGFLWLKTICVEMHHFCVFFFFNSIQCCCDYDLHFLVITDSVSQHGDLSEHSGSRESLNVLRYEAKLPLNAEDKSKKKKK